jgi:hypothetical protein
MRADVPAGLAAVLDRMLAKDPADRYATPAEVAEALGPFTDGADPARLLDGAGAAAGLANHAAATPGPSLWETASLSGRRRKSVPMTRRDLFTSAARALGIALPLVAVALALWYFWPTLWGRPGNPTVPLTVSDPLVKHIGDGETDRGDLRTSTAVVRVRHGVTVEATFSAPAYYYLIAFNPAASPAGIEQLCQPDDEAGFGAPAAVPEPKSAVRFPRDGSQFKLDAPGLQAFVLVGSSKPLPTYKEWRARAGEIPWAGTRDGGAWRWQFDGREFTRLPQERGSIEGAPKPLRELCNWFKNRPEFDVVQVFAFPVVDR